MSGIWIKTANGWREFHKECSNSNQLQGVFRPGNEDINRILMAARAERFCRALTEFHPVTHASEFRGDHLVEPLFGPFGEKL